jgi:zinc transporter 5/7
MQGIFLHILADTLGSFAVIISTLLTMRNSWYGWDPIASSFITILILVSAYPLIKNTSKSLMGNMPDNIDYEIRELLRGITQLRGVVGYKAVKFYVYDAEGDGIAHEHTHDHSADEKHAHDHDHLDHHDMNLAQPCYPPGYTGSDPNHSDSDHSDRFPYAPLQVDKHHIYGTLHVYAAKGISVMDVYEKVDEYVRSRGFEMNLQIERHGAKPCWCTRKKT